MLHKCEKKLLRTFLKTLAWLYRIPRFILSISTMGIFTSQKMAAPILSRAPLVKTILLKKPTKTRQIGLTWRTNLESIFNIPVFLKYLAVNGIIQNWDTYGNMPHNFYLYNDPDNNKLTWIPWDHNEALQEGNMQGALNLDFSDLNSNSWPLIEPYATTERDGFTFLTSSSDFTQAVSALCGTRYALFL